MGKNQHYVPRFFLRSFKSKEKRINIYNLKREKSIKDVGLYNQCKKSYMYGGDKIEDLISKFENEAAPVIKEIVGDRRPQTEEDGSLYTIVAFISFQYLRTERRGEVINAIVDRMSKSIFKEHPDFSNEEIESIEVGYDRPVTIPLSNWDVIIDCISDLRYSIVLNRSDKSFISSDDPVFQYNQYLESAEHPGTGALSVGLQMFLPVSPDVCILAYDDVVYKSDSISRILYANESDVYTLNVMQSINALENLYFDDYSMSDYVDNVYQKSKKYRESTGVVINEYVSEDDEDKALVSQHLSMPNLSLYLSFLEVRKSAKKIPLYERVNTYRKKPPPLPDHLKHDSQTGTGGGTYHPRDDDLDHKIEISPGRGD